MLNFKTIFISLFLFQSALANQVFYRFGSSDISSSREGEIFTDVAKANGSNNGDSGLSIGAGVDLDLFKCPLNEKNSVIGEIFVNYTKFSEEKVASAAHVLATADTSKKKVNVSELAVTIAPKYKFNSQSKLSFWVIPIGLSFLVNSPPSDTTNYLDTGLHFGVGAEYLVHEKITLGLDFRRFQGSGDSAYKFESNDFGAYLALNF